MTKMMTNDVIERERKQLYDELVSARTWLRDSSGFECGEPIDSLIEDSGDIYEVHVNLYLNNGRTLKLRNRCPESYHSQHYKGDSLYFFDGEEDVLCVDFYDSANNFHQARVPLSSICYVDMYTTDIDWQKYKDEWNKN